MENMESGNGNGNGNSEKVVRRTYNMCNAPINEMPHLPPPGAGGGFANRGELNPHPWGPKFWLIPHYFVYYLDIIT